MRVEAATRESYWLLHEGSLALAQIEANGIKIDVDYLDRAIVKTHKKIARMEEELKQDPIYKTWKRKFGEKTNFDSGPQIAHMAYEELGYECKFLTKKGKKPSTSEEALQDIDIPFFKKLLEAKDYKKTAGTFLKGIWREVVDGFLHPVFNAHITATFRLSSSEPNFQNFPRRDETMARLVRRCFIPRYDYFWEDDLKGIEVGINACINKDPVLLEYVRTDPGRMHKDAAADLFMIKPEEVVKTARDRAKNQYVFASFYGSYYCKTAPALWDSLQRLPEMTVGQGGIHILEHLRKKGITELGACDPENKPLPGTFEAHVKKVDDALWNRFKVYAQWRKDQHALYQRQGYFITPTGFRISWGKGGLLSRNDCICYPAQGSAAHCCLLFIIILQKWLRKYKFKTRLIGTIHDSVEGDSPENEMQDVMEKSEEIFAQEIPKKWPWIVVPLQTELEVPPKGLSWYDKKPWEKVDGIWGPKEVV